MQASYSISTEKYRFHAAIVIHQASCKSHHPHLKKTRDHFSLTKCCLFPLHNRQMQDDCTEPAKST